MAEHEGFTPGPWRVEPMDQTIPMFGITSGTGDWWIGCSFENQADANLAADAPRLLAENARLREDDVFSDKRWRASWALARASVSEWVIVEGRYHEVIGRGPTPRAAFDSALSAAGEEG